MYQENHEKVKIFRWMRHGSSSGKAYILLGETVIKAINCNDPCNSWNKDVSDVEKQKKITSPTSIWKNLRGLDDIWMSTEGEVGVCQGVLYTKWFYSSKV